MDVFFLNNEIIVSCFGPFLSLDVNFYNDLDFYCVDTGVEVVSRPEEVEEEAVARSTRTEKASDGGKVTTTTTVTTHKTKGKMIDRLSSVNNIIDHLMI